MSDRTVRVYIDIPLDLYRDVTELSDIAIGPLTIGLLGMWAKHQHGARQTEQALLTLGRESVRHPLDDDETRRVFVEACDGGATRAELADQFRISEASVTLWRRRLGMPKMVGPRAEPPPPGFREAVLGGATISRLSVQFGVTEARAFSWKRSLGLVQARTRSA